MIYIGSYRRYRDISDDVQGLCVQERYESHVPLSSLKQRTVADLVSTELHSSLVTP